MPGLNNIIGTFVQAIETSGQKFGKDELRQNLPEELKKYSDEELTALFKFHGICYVRLQNNSTIEQAKIGDVYNPNILFHNLSKQTKTEDDFAKQVSSILYEEILLDLELFALYLDHIGLSEQELFHQYQNFVAELKYSNAEPAADGDAQPSAAAADDSDAETAATGAKLLPPMHDVIITRAFYNPADFSDFTDKLCKKGESIKSLTFLNVGNLYIDNIILLVMSLPHLQSLRFEGTTTLQLTHAIEKEEESFANAIATHPALTKLVFCNNIPKNLEGLVIIKSAEVRGGSHSLDISFHLPTDSFFLKAALGMVTQKVITSESKVFYIFPHLICNEQQFQSFTTRQFAQIERKLTKAEIAMPEGFCQFYDTPIIGSDDLSFLDS